MTPARSSSAAREPALLLRTGPLDQPVSVFRRLYDEDVGARMAKDAVDALADEGRFVCDIPEDTDFAALSADLAGMNVRLRRRRTVGDPASFLAEVRTRRRLSQREFAGALGLDVRTLQNWEQGRNRPDASALAMATLFDRDPALVDELIFEAGT